MSIPSAAGAPDTPVAGSVAPDPALPGNIYFRIRNSAILSVTAVDAPIVATSESFDERLAETYERTGVRPGMLAVVAGIEERRWWPEDVSFADAAAMAGAKAIAEAGIDPRRFGLMIDSSVCRDHLEPSKAVAVHHQLGLASSCLTFDLANACLGFVNAIQLASTMIDAGQIEYALIVDGEGSRRPQEATIDRLRGLETTRADILDNFATLTLGSGGAAMVLGRASEHPEGHRFVGGVGRAATQHNRLCVGDLEKMTTDSRGLLEAAVTLAVDTWRDASAEFDWRDLDAYVIHQVSKVHTAAITSSLEIDPDRTPVIFPTRGNIGPASVPFTLALNSASFEAGQRIACMGIGSGLNSAVIEIAW
jgi:3-oxoacyl-[acyl-carrier-protein] synthase-3